MSYLLMEIKKKIERLRQIVELAKSGTYKFSFLLAIIEKATDATNRLSLRKITARFLCDYRQIVGLIGKENMRETPEELKVLIGLLMDENYVLEERAELGLKGYLAFLKYFNSLGIKKDPEPPSRRLELARKITDHAETLDISRGHPVITVCVASIYGNMDARGILKVDPKGKFNPSNALGDIMSFYRFAKAKFVVQARIPGLPVVFRTEDESLERMHAYYVAHASIKNNGEMHFSFYDLNAKKMFPRLYKQGSIKKKELDELYKMLNFSKSVKNNV
ncbi:hypothetical protein GMW71_11220 [Pectobacterium brasiliense]|nr:hypothetical protein GMW71_11220 [Pectobacterium brasiliense]